MESVNTKSALLPSWLWIALVALAVTALCAQVPSQPHRRVGLPQDWTQQHVIFSQSGLSGYPDLASQEPRIAHQWLRQHIHVVQSSPSFSEAGDPKRDWSFSLGNARIAAGMSPAKYGFDTTAAPSCANDYVVFGLNVAGSATQANIMAFNNLYSGTGGLCGTGGPSVLFSYNVSTVGGRIATSTILSLDGTKIGFVETSGTQAIFHVLTWAKGTGNGTSANAPAVPGTGNTASMVNLTLGGADARSSPWIDYASDTVYVGNGSGRVYKITGVFKGTPQIAAGWPVIVSAGRNLTGPVLDRNTNRVFVGDSNGRLLSFDSSNGGNISTLAIGQSGSTGAGIIDPPIVDSSNGIVYAVSSNAGTNAVLVQANATNLSQLARANIGLGSAGGTNIAMYSGTPDNNYFNAPSTGSLLVCGTATNSTAPVAYTFGFTGTTLNTTPVSSVPIVTSTRSHCSPITEFFNPNVGTGTDFFFFGINIDCFGANTTGCIMVRQIPGAAPLPVNEAGGTSGIVIDNQSTAGQASSIYFTNEPTAASAIKLTQSGLN